MKRRATPKNAPTESKRARVEVASEPTRKLPSRQAKKEPLKITKAPAKTTRAPKKIATTIPPTKTKPKPAPKKIQHNKPTKPIEGSPTPFSKRRKWDEVDDILQVQPS